MKNRSGISALISAAIALCLTSAPAFASPRSLLVDAEGADATAVASAIDPGGDWAKTDASKDVGPAGRALASPSAKKALLDRARKAVTDAHADAALVVIVNKTKHARRATLLLVGGDGDTPLVDTVVALGLTPAAADAGKLSNALAPGLAKLPAKAPEPPPVAAEASTPPSIAARDDEPSRSAAAADAATPAADKTTAPGRAWDRSLVTVGAGFQLQSRSMTYHDAIGSPKTYDLPASPAVAADLEFFPAGRSKVPVLRDLGLVGDFATGLGLTSAPANGGASIDTSWLRWNAGLRGRARIGGGRTVLVLGATAGMGQESFSFSGGGSDLPSVNYTYLRGMLDASVPIGPVVLVAAGGFLPVLSGGDVADRFRGTKVNAMEASLGVRAPFARFFEARLSADYTRYFYAFDPQPGDAFVAGGALDQMMRFQVTLAAGY